MEITIPQGTIALSVHHTALFHRGHKTFEVSVIRPLRVCRASSDMAVEVLGWTICWKHKKASSFEAPCMEMSSIWMHWEKRAMKKRWYCASWFCVPTLGKMSCQVKFVEVWNDFHKKESYFLRAIWRKKNFVKKRESCIDQGVKDIGLYLLDYLEQKNDFYQRFYTIISRSYVDKINSEQWKIKS